MNRRGLARLAGVSLLGVVASGPVHADDWVPLTGAETLREFVSGASAEIELKPGVIAKGEYRADGTATIRAWNESFERSWEVRGDDRVCYSSFTETHCYTFERNLDTPGEYRSRHTETGEVILFRVRDTDPRVVTRAAPSEPEGGLGSPSAGDIAAELSNPNTTMGTMNALFDFVAYDGDLPNADSQKAFRGLFQPSLPYPISESVNLYVRPAIPVIFSQDVPNAAGGYDSEGVELGDISFDAFLGKSVSPGLVVGAGVVGTFPTATEDALGLDQWLLGPEALVARIRKWGVIGILVTHQWDVAGEDDFSTSVTGGQYFYAVNLSNGWQVTGAPVYSYNHKADGGNDWTLPLAAGVSKTAILKGRPWKFTAQYWHYVESPDVFGPDNQIRIGISPVVALPW